MIQFVVWRRQHQAVGKWMQTGHTISARSAKEATSKMERMFANADFHSMALVAIPAGQKPNVEQ